LEDHPLSYCLGRLEGSGSFPRPSRSVSLSSGIRSGQSTTPSASTRRLHADRYLTCPIWTSNPGVMPLPRYGTPGTVSQARPALSLDSTLLVPGQHCLLVPSYLPNLITFSSHLRLRCSLAFRNHDDMSHYCLMSIPSWLLVSVGQRRLHARGPFPH